MHRIVPRSATFLLVIFSLGLASGYAAELLFSVCPQCGWRGQAAPGAPCPNCGYGGSSTGSGNSSASSGPTASQIRRAEEAAAREDRARRTSEWNRLANAAVDRRDYREALRLYREQQKVIDGPNVREGIANMEAVLAWSEARTAAEYRRALNLQPSMFSADNRIFVENLEQQEAAARKAAEDAAKVARDRAAGSRLNDEAVDLLAAGRFDEARAKLTEARRLSPDDKQINANYWIAWANLALRDGSIDNMITYLESAVKWDPDNAKAKALLTRAQSDRESQRSNVQTALTESRNRLLGRPGDSSGPTKPGAFGAQESNPALAVRPAAGTGTDTTAGNQLLSAVRTTKLDPDQDLALNYDVGGAPAAGSLPTVNPATMPARVRDDPRMAAPLQQLTELQSKRATLEKEHDALVVARGQASTTLTMALQTERLRAKEKEQQENLAAIVTQEAVVAKAHRQISSEIEPGPEVSAPEATAKVNEPAPAPKPAGLEFMSR